MMRRMLWPSLAVVVLLHATTARSNQDGQDFEVVQEAIPIRELVDGELAQTTWGVVVIASGELEALTKPVRISARKALKTASKYVGGVRSWKNTEEVRHLPDRKLARKVAHELDVDRVLLIRIYPGGPPKALFTVLDQQGESLQSVSTMSVIVPRAIITSKGAARIMRSAQGEDDP